MGAGCYDDPSIVNCWIAKLLRMVLCLLPYLLSMQVVRGSGSGDGLFSP